MAAQIPPAMIKSLRSLVASAISDAKAYDVPALCRRLGLSDGSEEEAYRSKYKYAQTRLIEVGAAAVLAAARALLAEDDHYELAEQVAKIDELAGPQVSGLTRRKLIAHFEGAPLVTEVEEIDFLRSVWPLHDMRPPHQMWDGPNSMEEAVIRHTVANPDDWSQRELLQHLGLMDCSRAQLFRFLSASLDPHYVSEEVQRSRAPALNKLLEPDGYALVQSGRVSGSPVYEVRPAPIGAPSDAIIAGALAAFDPSQISGRWQAALERRSSDPAGAITLARTLLEDVCKWILTEAEEPYREADDLPALYRKLSGALNLAPDGHTEQVFKQILGSCQSIVESLGALRNKLSDAHSPGPKRAKPQPRHAELAVNLAGAMATFLISTWEARRAAPLPNQ